MKCVPRLALLLLIADALFAGVRPLGKNAPRRPFDPIDARASAGLFVGVRDFKKDADLTEVKYAVDDAVDLAYELAVDQRPPLMTPDRVVLALSGDPQKSESKKKLEALLAAGATRHDAEQSDVLLLLESQSGSVGRNGILVVSFATHGISDEGTQYLFLAGSLVKYRETMITEAKVRDIVASHGAARSLIIVDACRERLTRDRRTGDPDPRSTSAFLSALGSVEGQAVLSAAAGGEWAYDDDKRQNGVFTSAVIDGLRCGAAADARGFITVDTLWTYVQQRVLSWIQVNKNPSARKAAQFQCDGLLKTMPLAQCPNRTASSPPPQSP